MAYLKPRTQDEYDLDTGQPTAIEIDPDHCGGTKILAGTRYPVSQLLAELAEGASIDDLANDVGLSKDTLSQALQTLARHFRQQDPPECDHPWHRNPGLAFPCPSCREGAEDLE